MPDFRAFCGPTAAEPSELVLSPEESHHLVAVNRARVGDPVVAFDGRGREWTTELTVARKNAAVLAVRSMRQVAPLPFDLTLAQALPKGPAMDAIVRKATEIGARRLVPVASERSQVHLDGERSEKKTEKWHTAALEAAKQCGNAFVPEIAPVQTTAQVIASAGSQELKLIASLHSGAKSLKPVLAAFHAARGRAPKSALWLIGPEGDFTTDEMAAALAAGFEPITLGPLVLRSETAATYALSVLSYELLNGYQV
jgi:16S rRNA (uracil1498-N3)-methyltransferase